MRGPCDEATLITAHNVGITLLELGKHVEAIESLREPLSNARSTYGDNHMLTLDLRSSLASNLAESGDLREALSMREDVLKRT